METLIDLFELTEPVIETYRASYRVEADSAPSGSYSSYSSPSMHSRVTLDHESEYDYGSAPRAVKGHSSEGSVRARLWATED